MQLTALSKNIFFAMIKRETLIAFRQTADLLNPLLFFIIVVSLFPLGISPELSLIHTIAPGIIWIAALLATLLALDKLFRSDYEDGSLEQLLLQPVSLPYLMLAKVMAHWLLTALPLILITPLLAALLHMTPDETVTIVLSLLLGTPSLILIGAIAVALTVNLRGNGFLLALLVLPLYIPILIFGAGSVVMVGDGLSANGLFAILGAILALTLTLAPLAIAAALRIGAN